MEEIFEVKNLNEEVEKKQAEIETLKSNLYNEDGSINTSAQNLIHSKQTSISSYDTKINSVLNH